ncbi:histidine kinase [Neosynechococcus sphagnicola sy1]|uniref:Histidine kinase n=1 Tax=Neosynechococcus sphagnicola sy1 TaxID=1497020 RepID=A0A098TMS9_9CYAN|nr:chemotaxis protein CheW [Neosynechococcus sphagnicola]KGF73594.1 histidine kinase [Neosynechococcus sphagnicola sy1]
MNSDFHTVSETAAIPLLDDCWNRIGVMGDRTCGELKTVIHCHNCPVYSAAGRSLLERAAPAAYLQEWTEVLAATTAPLCHGERTLDRATDTISVIIFRLSHERLALPVSVLQEVTHLCRIHTVPHRSNALFLGILNIRGEMLLCASLSHLLKLTPPEELAAGVGGDNHSKRLIVTEHRGNQWVFPVDEIYGIYRFHRSEFQAPPVVISQASETYTQGVLTWQTENVNFLDADLLFSTLNRQIF